jgi:hypothetical protein
MITYCEGCFKAYSDLGTLSKSCSKTRVWRLVIYKGKQTHWRVFQILGNNLHTTLISLTQKEFWKRKAYDGLNKKHFAKGFQEGVRIQVDCVFGDLSVSQIWNFFAQVISQVISLNPESYSEWIKTMLTWRSSTYFSLRDIVHIKPSTIKEVPHCNYPTCQWLCVDNSLSCSCLFCVSRTQTNSKDICLWNCREISTTTFWKQWVWSLTLWK